MQFVSKVVVVTGAASGIGLATTRAFAREGAVVVINDLNAADVERAVQDIESHGGTAIGAVADVSDEVAVEDAVRGVLDRQQHIDVLVNNAGFFISKPTAELSTQEWRRILSVNLDGCFYWARAVAAWSMLPRRSGVIINVASLAGLVAGPHSAAYTASKHGVVGLTKALAVEWAPYDIRVNAVCPGLTETELVASARTNYPQMFAERLARIPSGKVASAEDQANAILFLASEQARSITGLAMNIDGGTLAMSSGYSPIRP